jgi:Uma2 family endonuclease
MEVYKMLPEGTLAELIEGKIYMSPSPMRRHQRVVTLLGGRLAVYAEENQLGEVYVSPFDVYLDETNNAVQPDIIFVSTANLSIVGDHIHGVPDMLIEVLSPGNQMNDLKIKKNLYQKAGVREYWIIDPNTKEATGFFLEDTQYVEFYKAKRSIHSNLLKAAFSF